MDSVSKIGPLPKGDLGVVGPLQFDVVIEEDADGNVLPKPPLPDALKPKEPRA